MQLETIKLMLLPGMDGTGDLFAPFLAALGSDCEAVVVRYPTSQAFDYSRLESIARAAIPTGPFVLLGESFSGPIAISIAASNPPQLKGVILCASFARNPRPWLAGLRAVADLLPMSTIPIGLLSRFLFGSFQTPSLRSQFAQSLSQVSQAVFAARLKAVLSVDVSEKLRATTVPMLYLLAKRDRVVPPSAVRLVVRLRPDTRIASFDAPHFLLQTTPREAAQMVRSFMREIDLRHAS